MPQPRKGALPSLQTLYDPLPAVSHDVSGPLGQAALKDYQNGHLRDPSGAAQMFHDAWTSLVYTHDDPTVAAINALEQKLLSGQIGQNSSSSDTTDPDAAAWQALGSTASNAAALNNAAIALMFVDAGNFYGRAPVQVDGFTVPFNRPGASVNCTSLSSGAFWLLDKARTLFPDDPTLLVNTAVTGQDDAATHLLTRASQALPEDVTLRLALAAQVRAGSASYSGERSTLQPLLAYPRTAPLGHAAIGQSYLAEADSESFTGRTLARRAIEEFDWAMAGTTDPGVYTGRAQALELLGRIPEAIQSERAAVHQAPDSPGYRVLLGWLEAENGDVQGMHRETQAALTLVMGGWDMSLSQIHLGKGAGQAYDGGLANHVDPPPMCGGGGAGLIFTSTIPKFDRDAVSAQQQQGSTYNDVLTGAIVADMLTGNAVDAQHQIARWHAIFDQGPGGINSPVDQAVAIATDSLAPASDGAVNAAQNDFRYAGKFGKARALCQRASTLPKTTDFDPATGVICAAESQYLMGIYQDRSDQERLRDFKAASTALEGALKLKTGQTYGSQDRSTLQFETVTALEAAATSARRLGRVSQASSLESRVRQLLLAVVAAKPTDGSDAEALSRLGDLDFTSGHIADAIREYTAAIERQPSFPFNATQYLYSAYNNRGISRLLLIQPRPDAPPDCAGSATRCAESQADFNAALRGDPQNPIYLMNLGWVERLQGHDQQARSDLAAATTDDPTLFPALNDLGVLEAESGNTQAAKHDFEEALAANSRYDLPVWNLGVLNMRDGVRGILTGQAYLARAIRMNRSWRLGELEYRTDERVYRYLVGPDIQSGATMGRNLGFATAAFGWIAILGALFQAIRSLLTEKARDRVAEEWEERGSELQEKVHRRLQRFLGGSQRGVRPKRWWARWWQAIEPWLVTIPAVVLVSVLVSRRETPQAAVASAVLIVCATVLAVLTHESGHILTARLTRIRLRRSYWRVGVPFALAMAFVPMEISLGPYVGHQVDEKAPKNRAWWVYAGGPLANLLVAAGTYALYLFQSIPALRLCALAQLAVCGYALLPLEALDGKDLGEHPSFTFALGILLLGLGVLATLGIV